MRNLVAIIACLLFGTQSAYSQDQNNVYANNIVIVLDTSGSMSEKMRSQNISRIDAAKKALNVMIDNFPEEANVGLLIFSNGENGGWLNPLGPAKPISLKASVNKLTPNGGTPLGEFIKKGADALLEQRSKQFGYGSYRLIVVTDGAANDANDMDRYAKDIVSRGIYLDVTGVDMQQDHTLSALSNTYRRADSPETLAAAMQEAIAEIGSAGQQDVDTSAMFDEISGLSEDVASEMIRLLNESGNHPIGEKPPTQSSSAIPVATPNSISGAAVAGIALGAVIILVIVAIISAH